jgi:N6-adenosine-specific RNA methylase IME4
VKGKGFAPKKNNNSLSSLIGGKPISAQRHSKKPEETYDLIEARSEGPYLEMFARNYRLNWDSFGNEVDYTPTTSSEEE